MTARNVLLICTDSLFASAAKALWEANYPNDRFQSFTLNVNQSTNREPFSKPTPAVTTKTVAGWNNLCSLIASNTHIVFATSTVADTTKNMAFVLNEAADILQEKKLIWWKQNSWSDIGLVESLAKNRHPHDPAFQKEANIQLAQEHFNNTFNLNATFFIAKELKRTDAALEHTLFCFYTVQTILALKRLDLTLPTKNDVFICMARGFSNTPTTQYHSTPSFRRIWDNLEEKGIVARATKRTKTAHLTPLGQHVASALSHALFFPGINQKIEAWALNWPEKKQDMDEFLIHMFAQQVAKNSFASK